MARLPGAPCTPARTGSGITAAGRVFKRADQGQNSTVASNRVTGTCQPGPRHEKARWRTTGLNVISGSGLGEQPPSLVIAAARHCRPSLHCSLSLRAAIFMPASLQARKRACLQGRARNMPLKASIAAFIASSNGAMISVADLMLISVNWVV